MKTVLLAAISALLLTGAVQANDIIITDTVSGTISGAADYDANGNNLGSLDGTGEFGAESLVGQSFSLTSTIDLTELQDDGTLYTDGSTYYEIIDSSNDNAISTSLTIGVNNYTQTGYNSELAIYSGYYNQVSDIVQNSTLPYASIQISGYNYDASNPLASIDPSQIQALTGQLLSDPQTYNGIYVAGPTGGEDNLTFAASSAPEPTTWLSLATGLGGLALLKFRRSRSRC